MTKEEIIKEFREISLKGKVFHLLSVNFTPDDRKIFNEGQKRQRRLY